MLKILIADDEKMIRDSISTLIDWKKLDVELIGTARNGIEAYNMILDKYPEIVLTDIKMPGLSGLELIRRIHDINQNTQFIILSGYGEFEFAKQAMEYGVRHYLLKPCTEEQIIHSVQDAREDYIRLESLQSLSRKEKDPQNSFYNYILFDILKCYLDMGEQILDSETEERFYQEYHRYVGSADSAQDVYYLYFIDEEHIRSSMEQIEIFFQEKYPGIRVNYFYVPCTLIIVFSQPPMEGQQLIESFIEKHFLSNINRETSYSHTCFPTLRDMFRKLASQTKRFSSIQYYSQGKLLTIRNADNMIRSVHSLSQALFDPTAQSSIAIGDLRDILHNSNDPMEIRQIIAAVIFTSLHFLSEEDADYLIRHLSELELLQDLIPLKKQVLILLEYIYSHRKFAGEQNRLSDRVKKYVYNHLEDPRLSLKWIAETVLFMNVDYLSRRFTKETGEHFSAYLTRKRIQRAQFLFQKNPSANINDVAEQVGCGNNPQYFSQIFKKATGMTPSSYLKTLIP